MRFIELNPVRAGMVIHPADYWWSSYGANAQGAENALLTEHSLYSRLGSAGPERKRAYRQLFRGALSSHDLASIREATNKGWVLGNDRFREKVERLSGRRAAPKVRGRPRGGIE